MFVSPVLIAMLSSIEILLALPQRFRLIILQQPLVRPIFFYLAISPIIQCAQLLPMGPLAPNQMLV
jgi:hypothetical protein